MEGFYYDNVLITEKVGMEPVISTIRYTSDIEWYTNTLVKENKYETYTGSIEIFNESTESVFQTVLNNGEASDTFNKSASKTNRWRTVGRIQTYGTVINGIFYLEGINIFINNCGGDRSFLNGSDSSTGNPSTNPRSEGNDGESRGGGGGRGKYVRTAPVEYVLNTEEVLEELAPDDPIVDLAKFLECFDTNDSAIITIYANQPIEGSELAGNPINLDVGHAFVSIQQYENISTFGFYPEGEGIKAASGPSIIGNNGGNPYDISISKEVNVLTLAKIISTAINFPDNYHLSNYNCTDYAVTLGNLAGMNIPSAVGAFPIPSCLPIRGSNPGKLGEVLRSMDGQRGVRINRNGTYASRKSQSCSN